MNQRRLDAFDAVLRSLRTGENTAVEEAKAAFAPSVSYHSGNVDVSGMDAVVDRLNGQWPLTPVYAKGEWTEPEEVDGALRISARFPTFGSIKGYALKVSFDGSDRITRLDETVEMYPPPTATDALPAVVRTAINGALANNTPITVAYTGDDGRPVLSLRGSTQVYGKAALSMWVRNPKGGTVEAARAGKAFSLLYRDSSRRMTLVMSGKGRIADGAERERVWSISPEVEKRHDPERKGVAVIIDLDKVAGNTPSGPVLVAP